MATGFLIGGGRTALAAFSFITDTAVRPPPTSGPYAYSPPYGSFLPGQAGFPGVGGSYVDPVFGTTIRRLSGNALTNTSFDSADIYVKNGWFNADGTYFVNTFQDGTVGAINTSTGAIQPLTNAGGAARSDASCSPVNPDVFYYFAGTSLKKQLISTGAVSTVKTFTGTLGALGGSTDWIDNSGQYMLLNFGGGFTAGGTPSFRVWDSVNDILFTGTIADDPGGGWAGISPGGDYVVLIIGANKYSYAINKTAHTIATTGYLFYTGGGDHSDLMLASDGNTYLVRVNNDSTPSFVERINVATGVVTNAYTFPSDAYYTATPEYTSCVSKGPWQDWAYMCTDIEAGPTVSTDNFNVTNPVGSWNRLQNEVFRINVLTGVLQRLCHTRNRETASIYNYYPRLCASWDGSRIAWASNMGFKSSPLGYIDIWSMAVPGAGSSPGGGVINTADFRDPNNAYLAALAA